MASIEKFEDLDIWQLARQLVRDVYKLTRKKEFSKDYGLKDQIRRSSVSVMSNISEGFESRITKRFINYLGHSKGSCGETRSLSYVALDCNYITDSEFHTLFDRCTTISKKTKKLISYLEGYSSNDRVKDILVDYGT
ncbi:four helix bundle protein [Aliifodinibius salipaludis]|uniref:Four helix bundle protein n=1 Tax=Fodinibius salipaludis TaxID=2032627 RepID=A0A2A2G7D9_9BACT|nr:four helix bundle protein [Aliifodinibius salipaludis]PAU93208.1 four helix bundle protein [Aliifodinibius salipaludis]